MATTRSATGRWGLDRPVFVVGPPRSGTTLLRVQLCRHPALWILTETHLLDLWAARHPGLVTGDRDAFEAYWTAFTATDAFGYLQLDADGVAARVRADGRYRATDVLGAMLAEAAAARGVARVGEKTPDHAHHVGALLDAFPDARVLWLVRDPVATVASELALDRDWASDVPGVAARRWAAGVADLPRWQPDPRVAVVRFEDLVADPPATLRRACQHVALDWDDALLADEGGHDAYVHGRRDPWGRLDPGAAAVPADLSPRALEAIDDVTAELATLLGYPRPRARARGAGRVVFTALRTARTTRDAVRGAVGATGTRGATA